MRDEGVGKSVVVEGRSMDMKGRVQTEKRGEEGYTNEGKKS